jgi:hypothetical protein
MRLDELVTAFTACTLPRAAWTHTAHLSVGVWAVDRHGARAALDLLRAGITRLNEHHGTANTPTGGYHETITAAYVTLIAAFLRAFGAASTLEARVEALLASPLAEPSALLRHWSKELLFSPRARAEWVPPDLEPLDG